MYDNGICSKLLATLDRYAVQKTKGVLLPIARCTTHGASHGKFGDHGKRGVAVRRQKLLGSFPLRARARVRFMRTRQCLEWPGLAAPSHHCRDPSPFHLTCLICFSVGLACKHLRVHAPSHQPSYTALLIKPCTYDISQIPMLLLHDVPTQVFTDLPTKMTAKLPI